MSTANLPLQVELALPPEYRFDVGDRQERASSFGVIKLTGEYDETYLLANTVHAGITYIHSFVYTAERDVAPW